MSWESTVSVVGIGPDAIDTGAQAVASTLTQVALIQLNGRKAYASLDVTVGAAALSHLQFSRSSVAGGTHTIVPAMTDTALNTPSADVPSAAPASLSTLAAGATGNIRLAGLQGVMELGIWAQCGTTTTLRVQGTFADAA